VLRVADADELQHFLNFLHFRSDTERCLCSSRFEAGSLSHRKPDLQCKPRVVEGLFSRDVSAPSKGSDL
jgi:hypothetical protein